MPKKGISSLNQKKEYNDWVLHIQISLHTKFQFKLTILMFWTNFTKKEHMWWPILEKKWTNYEFCIFEICHKRVFPVKNRKSEHPHWILHIQIILRTKFQFKLTILVFWTKLGQKGYFASKSEKINTIIQFCIFKSVYIRNFSLNWQF